MLGAQEKLYDAIKQADTYLKDFLSSAPLLQILMNKDYKPGEA